MMQPRYPRITPLKALDLLRELERDHACPPGYSAKIWSVVNGERVRVTRNLSTDNKAIAEQKLKRLLTEENLAECDIVDTYGDRVMEALASALTLALEARQYNVVESLAKLLKDQKCTIDPGPKKS